MPNKANDLVSGCHKTITLPSQGGLARSLQSAAIAVLILLAATGPATDSAAQGDRDERDRRSSGVVPRFQEFSDPDGRFANLNLGGPTDTTTNPFFQDLGSNGRRCVTHHQPSDAFSITPPHIRGRFEATKGTDPLFRLVDGANCPIADVYTLEERREAYSLLLTRGLIRVGIAVPANADYQVVTVYNPYGCNATDVISMYRRPLPTTNLPFLSAVMFDGRESSPTTGTTKILYDNYPSSLLSDLADQALDATVGHAEGDGTRPTAEEQQQIVDFETKLFTAQTRDRRAGDLHEDGAKGGPNPLHERDRDDEEEHKAARRSIARGEELFNTLEIPITDVAGINDDISAGGLVAGGIPSLPGTCGTCHTTPNVGNHSFATPLNIGTGDPSPDNTSVNLGGLDVSYLPEITVCKTDATSGLPSNNCKSTTDLGQALIDGKFDHIGKIKGPILRGLAGRAPYFHNGSAATLLDVINFYDTRFHLDLSERDKKDLVAFLKTL